MEEERRAENSRLRAARALHRGASRKGLATRGAQQVCRLTSRLGPGARGVGTAASPNPSRTGRRQAFSESRSELEIGR